MARYLPPSSFFFRTGPLSYTNVSMLDGFSPSPLPWRKVGSGMLTVSPLRRTLSLFPDSLYHRTKGKGSTSLLPFSFPLLD